MDSVKIVTDVLNKDLYALSKKFYEDLNYEKIEFCFSDKIYGFEFIDQVIKNSAKSEIDWAILIDEDCFITDKEALVELVNYTIQNNFDIVGMPDGGVCNYRYYNPIVINPFFCILNIKKIREKYNKTKILETTFSEDLKRFFPREVIIKSYNYDIHFESYYPFLFWLLKNNFQPKYLQAKDFSSFAPTVILKNHKGVDFAYHTWYARDWKDPQNKARIIQVIKHCNSIKK